MPYIPNSREDQKAMLDSIGLSKLDDLFTPIPEELRLKTPLPLPAPMSEPEVTRHLEDMAGLNRPHRLSFVGGGIYNHYVPPVVWSLAMRPEFATAYTPYQAEVAQGTLQVIYEYQTHICRLTGMDAANASMYDGATAMAEAAMLAVAYTGRRRIVVAESINPLYRDVLVTITGGRGVEIVTVPSRGGVTDYDRMKSAIDDTCAGVIVGQPNFFGYLEDIEIAEAAIHSSGGLFIMVADPISLGILKTPGEYGADIAVAEGQPLGLPQNFGGPLLGIFACRKEFLRQLPGRIVARTTDIDGRPGFVLTLQTREQHIRRDKATSNICTNEALCATAAAIYLSLMGKHGLAQVARLSTERAHYLADKIETLPGYRVWSERPFFREFVVETPGPPAALIAQAAAHGIAAGIDLGRFFSGLNRHLLVAVTEMNTVDDCDRFVSVLAGKG